MTQTKHLKHHERARDWVVTYCGRTFVTSRPKDNKNQIVFRPNQANCPDCINSFTDELAMDKNWDKEADKEEQQRQYEEGTTY